MLSLRPGKSADAVTARGAQRQRARTRYARWCCRWLTVLVALVMAVASAAITSVKATAQRPSPDQVEAAYIYNFGKFVSWPPAEAHGPLTICVVKQDDLRHIIAGLVGQDEIGGRAFRVESLKSRSRTGECSILYIGGADRATLDAYLRASAGKPVLTVGDAPDFLARGGILQFVLKRRHVRFSANLNAARRNHLKLSSELLKVANHVLGKPAEGGLR